VAWTRRCDHGRARRAHRPDHPDRGERPARQRRQPDPDQRAGLGIARVGGTGGHTSGDLFLAFATGNHLPSEIDDVSPLAYEVRAAGNTVIDALFDAVIEATEEAIVNALVAASTMVGRDGITAHALPHDRLLEVMARYGRPAARA
jgi:D-aminopeptidase